MSKLTPMMSQYMSIKDRHKDCILFFRLGDFYEMFFEDAIVASKVLEIALTGRDCGMTERAPMCGVPYHSANSYISRLIENDYKVAICEQVEDVSVAKGIVKRDVVRIITPGTVLEENLLDNKTNNYLLALFEIDESVGIAFVDITTGELSASQVKASSLIEEIAKISPKEIIYNDITLSDKLSKICLLNNIFLNKAPHTVNSINENEINVLLKDVKVENEALGSLRLLFDYVLTSQKHISINVNAINIYDSSEYMAIDMFTRNNLEITETLRNKHKKGSLLHIIDKTSTSMGGRLIRKWLIEPLINKTKIDKRLDLIEEINKDFNLREDLTIEFKKIYDIERLSGKIAYEKINPKELISLKESLKVIPSIIDLLKNSNAKNVRALVSQIDDLTDIYELIDSAILEEPAIGLKDGNIIKESYNEQVKKLRDYAKNGTRLINEIEAKEKEKTGIRSLKIGFNKVFGYYIEITHSNLKNFEMPSDYIRKQTLSNAERFITEELKEVEENVLSAVEKIKDIEYELFVGIRNSLYSNISRIQNLSKTIAYIDALLSLSKVATENGYSRPMINEDGNLIIQNGRHPVVEALIGEANFVSNDTKLNNENDKIAIITGPNMAGKSTYMRQVAVICLLAHMGSFVPADMAEIPIIDRIFTRVGASDDLSQGQSTFMVEMSEVSYIIKNATKNSLIILDEIGRGTSTFDGLSLAWSIVEYINANIKAKTLFATHYHELTVLEEKFPDIKNYSVAVEENGEDIIFLRKIISGGADKSYGIHVAKLANLPDEIIQRANEILEELQNENIDDMQQKNTPQNNEVVKEKFEQISFNTFEYDGIIKELTALNIINMTPLEAMNSLYALQNKVKLIGDKINV